MKNYKIHFKEEEREAVLGIIARSNDIVLNQVEPTSVYVTIQLEDDDADVLYSELLVEIERDVRTSRETIVVEEKVTIIDDGSPGPDMTI